MSIIFINMINAVYASRYYGKAEFKSPRTTLIALGSAILLALGASGAAGCSNEDDCDKLRREFLGLICNDGGVPPQYTKEIFEKTQELQKRGCGVPSGC